MNLSNSSSARAPMGRKRANKNAWLPKYVRIHKGRYVYTPYLGTVNGKIKWGKEVVLGRDGDPRYLILKRFDEEANSISGEFTVAWLMDEFAKSDDYAALSAKTKREYAKFHKIISDKPIANGVFGMLTLEKVTSPVVRQYLDKRRSEGAPISGNKEVGYLSSAWSWLRQRREGIPPNPCIGVKRNPRPQVTTGEHYVEDVDYMHAMSLDGPWYIPVIMEIMMICRMRKVEVLALTVSDVIGSGLITKRTKGSKTNITKWTPRLRAAVDAAMQQPKKVQSIHEKNRYLISDEYNKAIPESTVDTAWQRRMQKQVSLGRKRFPLHWLKKKGVSDFAGDKLKASGHVDPSMLKVYDHKLDEVDGTA